MAPIPWLRDAHDLRVRPTVSPPSGPASGRTALVTGANRGIGLAIARGLADLGDQVALTARFLSDAEGRGARSWRGGIVRHADGRQQHGVGRKEPRSDRA
jgi:NAD(P)-dependent dehydrogenase (short-subunit alcohol dehydrogenase family)